MAPSAGRSTVSCAPPRPRDLLEFKTGRPREADRLQLDLYRRAAERLFPGTVVEARLVYAGRVDVIFTIGHSTHTVDEFLALLATGGPPSCAQRPSGGSAIASSSRTRWLPVVSTFGTSRRRRMRRTTPSRRLRGWSVTRCGTRPLSENRRKSGFSELLVRKMPPTVRVRHFLHCAARIPSPTIDCRTRQAFVGSCH